MEQSRGKKQWLQSLNRCRWELAGSSLLARHMEMEYNMMLRYSAKEARIHMDNVFADKDSAKALIGGLWNERIIR
ncbi:MAG TPA: hypothetical protein DEF35_29075 [Paenibacillus sp.]|uniref:hypothetical protein n=1 Tax=Paenibacillus TaxID=44249 RepID=UPI000B9FB460|nr:MULTISPECIES: hypothetical protein [Paenibacillus]OZQ60290.1 hypothetical protein CA599_30530 [Paenibacillus taichungensis]HBU85667.1 hypothetical protein [Paenibacillus sp.]